MRHAEPQEEQHGRRSRHRQCAHAAEARQGESGTQALKQEASEGGENVDITPQESTMGQRDH